MVDADSLSLGFPAGGAAADPPPLPDRSRPCWTLSLRSSANAGACAPAPLLPWEGVSAGDLPGLPESFGVRAAEGGEEAGAMEAGAAAAAAGLAAAAGAPPAFFSAAAFARATFSACQRKPAKRTSATTPPSLLPCSTRSTRCAAAVCCVPTCLAALCAFTSSALSCTRAPGADMARASGVRVEERRREVGSIGA